MSFLKNFISSAHSQKSQDFTGLFKSLKNPIVLDNINDFDVKLINYLWIRGFEHACKEGISGAHKSSK